jgi:signal-transduction protein with cAMP-binding, CBS, and nucleotidyltransferase domain
MHIRLRSQTAKVLQNEIPDNLINMEKLTHIEIATIKKLFASINNLQTKINFDFKGSF